ncbi:hypothetical protein LINPERPRIM_LOCUS39854 [Linum perenne]
MEVLEKLLNWIFLVEEPLHCFYVIGVMCMIREKE